MLRPVIRYDFRYLLRILMETNNACHYVLNIHEKFQWICFVRSSVGSWPKVVLKQLAACIIGKLYAYRVIQLIQLYENVVSNNKLTEKLFEIEWNTYPEFLYIHLNSQYFSYLLLNVVVFFSLKTGITRKDQTILYYGVGQMEYILYYNTVYFQVLWYCLIFHLFWILIQISK